MAVRKQSALSGFVAGALGGLVGTIVMDAFQRASLAGTAKAEELAGAGETFSGQQRSQHDNFEQAHEQVASAVVESTTGSTLSTGEKQEAGPLTHYLFGTLCGAVYGVLAEYEPWATFGFGTAFGTSLFVGATEAVLPAMGLIPGPADTPPLLHAGGLAAHAVYGSTTETVRRLMRHAI